MGSQRLFDSELRKDFPEEVMAEMSMGAVFQIKEMVLGG